MRERAATLGASLREKAERLGSHTQRVQQRAKKASSRLASALNRSASAASVSTAPAAPAATLVAPRSFSLHEHHPDDDNSSQIGLPAQQQQQAAELSSEEEQEEEVMPPRPSPSTSLKVVVTPMVRIGPLGTSAAASPLTAVPHLQPPPPSPKVFSSGAITPSSTSFSTSAAVTDHVHWTMPRQRVAGTAGLPCSPAVPQEAMERVYPQQLSAAAAVSRSSDRQQHESQVDLWSDFMAAATPPPPSTSQAAGVELATALGLQCYTPAATADAGAAAAAVATHTSSSSVSLI